MKQYVALTLAIAALCGLNSAHAMQREVQVKIQTPSAVPSTPDSREFYNNPSTRPPTWAGLLEKDVYFGDFSSCETQNFWIMSTDLDGPVAKSFDAIKRSGLAQRQDQGQTETYSIDNLRFERTVETFEHPRYKKSSHTIATYRMRILSDQLGEFDFYHQTTEVKVRHSFTPLPRFRITGHAAHLFARTMLRMVSGFDPILRAHFGATYRDPEIQWSSSGSLSSEWFECNNYAPWYDAGAECVFKLNREAQRVGGAGNPVR